MSGKYFLSELWVLIVLNEYKKYLNDYKAQKWAFYAFISMRRFDGKYLSTHFVQSFSPLACPWAIAPTVIATGSSFGTKSRGLTTFLALNDITTFLQPTGRWSVIGFLITFSNFKFPSDALTLYLWSNWTRNKILINIYYMCNVQELNKKLNKIRISFLNQQTKFVQILFLLLIIKTNVS